MNSHNSGVEEFRDDLQIIKKWIRSRGNILPFAVQYYKI